MTREEKKISKSKNLKKFSFKKNFFSSLKNFDENTLSKKNMSKISITRKKVSFWVSDKSSIYEVHYSF
ncbi:hypothetical protein BpHYR1_026340 [Brachionus plicatilis]|uniref:Uncharacterized protein n=1 Tax=Brachionus plicatilis TaxID=10195 RepID=A0A3M7Q607_BRAPC|nr:hypothetical protein BpHYR1_026340 [Brachionus plicatilis]